MVRNVIGDETHVGGFVDKLFESGRSVEAGLAVGRAGEGPNRDAVFALIPTPPKDEEEVIFIVGQEQKRSLSEADKRKGSKGKAAPSMPLQIDIDWVAEHARQVSKMLVGGIHVLGIYVLTSEGAFKSSTATLSQAMKAVAISTSEYGETGLSRHQLLLHISTSPRRISCRSALLGSSIHTVSLHPCEWKLGKVTSMLHSYKCLYNFETRIPVLAEKRPVKGMWEILSFAVSSEAACLKSAHAVIDGSLVMQDNLLSDGSSHEVELFLPLGCNEHVKGNADRGKVAGLVVFSGSVQAQSYCLPREPLSRAIEDLKGDIIKSLQSRLELLYDEAEQAMEDTTESLDTVQRKPSTPFICWMENIEYKCKLPRRVFIPWLDGVLACDYLQDNENSQDLNGRCIEMLGMSAPIEPSKILELESFIKHIDPRSFWQVVGGQEVNKEEVGGGGKVKSGASIRIVKSFSGSFYIWAVGFIFLAFILSWILR